MFSCVCNDKVVVRVTVKSVVMTGVEMEAVMGVSVALLTIYNRTESVSHKHAISEIRLISKTGGKSTVWT